MEMVMGPPSMETLRGTIYGEVVPRCPFSRRGEGNQERYLYMEYLLEQYGHERDGKEIVMVKL